MKKTLVTLLIASITIFSLAACGGAGSGSSGKDGSEPASLEASADTSADSVKEETESAAAEGTESISDNSAAEDAEEEENYETGDASLDNPRNQDEIGENELLVVSFGTSFNDSRRATIGAIEEALEKAFPEWSVRRAFTSQIIIDHINRRDKVQIDNVGEALDRAVKNGVKKLLINARLRFNHCLYRTRKFKKVFLIGFIISKVFDFLILLLVLTDYFG